MSLNIKIAKNYANSLWAQSRNKSNHQEVLRDIELFNDILLSNPKVGMALISPIIDKDRKIALMDALIKKKDFQKFSKYFLLVLIRNSRINLLTNILDEFASICMAASGIKLVEVVSANALSKKDQLFIKNILESKINTKIQMDSKVDKSLVGGIIVKYDSVIIDYSIKSALNNMEKLGVIL